MISKKSLLAVAVALSLPALAMAQNSARSGFTPDLRAATPSSVFAPNATITEGFDVVAGTPPCPTGWVCQNNSAPLGTSNWFQGNPAVFSAQAGAATAYIGANFNNTAGAGDISNWLVSPLVQFGPGSELRFWARVNIGSAYADRLEIRASSTGTATGASATSTGDFSILLGTINPGLATAGTCTTPATAPGAGAFPEDWCEFRLTNAEGLPLTGSGHIAFRYNVTNGGPTGANSNFIGIDTFSFVEGTAAPVGAARAVPALGSLSQLLMLLGVLGAGLVGVNLVSRRS